MLWSILVYWNQPCATAHAFTALHMISSTHFLSKQGGFWATRKPLSYATALDPPLHLLRTVATDLASCHVCMIRPQFTQQLNHSFNTFINWIVTTVMTQSLATALPWLLQQFNTLTLIYSWLNTSKVECWSEYSHHKPQSWYDLSTCVGGCHIMMHVS